MSQFLFIMIRKWYLATVIANDKINDDINMFLPRWPFRWPRRCTGAIQIALPNVACPGLLRKPLDAALGNYLLPITPAATRATGKQTTINKYTYKAVCFDGHVDAPVRNPAHCPMEEVQGFTRSHWMPPLGEYYV
jgi:hypothetical protein